MYVVNTLLHDDLVRGQLVNSIVCPSCYRECFNISCQLWSRSQAVLPCPPGQFSVLVSIIELKFLQSKSVLSQIKVKQTVSSPRVWGCPLGPIRSAARPMRGSRGVRGGCHGTHFLSRFNSKCWLHFFFTPISGDIVLPPTETTGQERLNKTVSNRTECLHRHQEHQYSMTKHCIGNDRCLCRIHWRYLLSDCRISFVCCNVWNLALTFSLVANELLVLIVANITNRN